MYQTALLRRTFLSYISNSKSLCNLKLRYKTFPNSGVIQPMEFISFARKFLLQNFIQAGFTNAVKCSRSRKCNRNAMCRDQGWAYSYRGDSLYRQFSIYSSIFVAIGDRITIPYRKFRDTRQSFYRISQNFAIEKYRLSHYPHEKKYKIKSKYESADFPYISNPIFC